MTVSALQTLVEGSEQQVVIPIHGDSSSCTAEWTVIELNGELVVPTEMPTAEKQLVKVVGPDQVELGSLRFQDEKTPVMVLGSHELRGTVESLKQPFCVFEKERGVAAISTAAPAHSTTTDNNDDKENSSQSQGELQYKVVGIITKKLLFNKYPKVIMK